MKENKLLETVDWRDFRLKISDKFSSPPVVMKIGGTIVATLGNFSASTGKAKSKKTFNVTAIVVSALINNKILEYVATFPLDKRKVLYVDTEQSPYHCQKVLSRIHKMAGFDESTHSDLLEFLPLRKCSPKQRISLIESAIYDINELGLVVIDGIRDLAYDINSPSEATDLISKLMKWTDERQIHIHTVLHLNKGDDNSRGHLGTELNNKAETVLQITKDEIDKDISYVSASYIRDIDFDTFAFKINEVGFPELVENYKPSSSKNLKGFDYFEVSEEKHKEALDYLFSEAEMVSYGSLIDKLKVSYAQVGYSFGDNKAKQLKVFLENKRMLIKDDKFYRFNPQFHY